MSLLADPGNGFGREARRCASSKRWQGGLDRLGHPVEAQATVNVRFRPLAGNIVIAPSRRLCWAALSLPSLGFVPSAFAQIPSLAPANPGQLFPPVLLQRVEATYPEEANCRPWRLRSFYVSASTSRGPSSRSRCSRRPGTASTRRRATRRFSSSSRQRYVGNSPFQRAFATSTLSSCRKPEPAPVEVVGESADSVTSVPTRTDTGSGAAAVASSATTSFGIGT